VNYTVLLRQTAEAKFMAAWIRAADKGDFFAAAEDVNRILERDPSNQGESRSGDHRIWFHRPLAVFYEIDETNHVVWITSIKWVGW
jgi:hypothetical protein